MTIGINTSPLAGRDNKLTAPQVKARLDQEVIGNVSIRVLDGDRPDRWEVQGRGELQLAVLVEVMRRGGSSSPSASRRSSLARSAAGCTNPWSAWRSTHPRSTWA